MNNRGTRITVFSSVNLSPVEQQIAIKNTVSIDFFDSIGILDCCLPSARLPHMEQSDLGPCEYFLHAS